MAFAKILLSYDKSLFIVFLSLREMPKVTVDFSKVGVASCNRAMVLTVKFFLKSQGLLLKIFCLVVLLKFRAHFC